MERIDPVIHTVPYKITPTLGPCGPAAGQREQFATVIFKVSINTIL
jgi:hypothetical protein